MRIAAAHMFIRHAPPVGLSPAPPFAFAVPAQPAALAGIRPAQVAALPAAAALIARERRQRALAGGRAVLAALGDMRGALLAGGGAAALQQLAQANAAAPPSGDPDLDDILDAIRLRAEVEIAKAQRR